MKTSIAILFFGIFHLGCSSSYIVSTSPQDEHISFSKFNAILENEKVTIVFQDDSRVDGRGILATPDSTSWLNPTTGIQTAAPTQKVKKIILTNRGLGTLEGMGIGVLAGGVVGLLTAVVTGPHPGEDGFTYAVYPILGGGVGLIAGPIYGVIKGHTYEYEFESLSNKP